MDSVDSALSNTLALSGRATFAELAEQVGLSAPSTADRVRRLELNGVIKGYHAEVDPAAFGRDITAFVAVSLATPAARPPFLDWVEGEADVLECHHISGDDDYLLKVVAEGTAGLERLVSFGIKGIEGVSRTRTTIVLTSAVERPFVPPVLP